MPQQTVLVDPAVNANQVAVDGNAATGQQMAARVSIRPMDFGQPFSNYGSYSGSFTTGTIAAGSGAVFVCAFRNGDPNRLMLIRRVRMHQGWVLTTTAAGACVAELLIARSYTVVDSTGGTLQTQPSKRRFTMGPSQATIYMSTTGALSGGTRVTDANSMATVVQAAQAAAGATMFQGALGNLWDAQEVGKTPIVLTNNEGFLVRSTAPATGTFVVSVDIDWDEVANY
jgi:hypothetical protein